MAIGRIILAPPERRELQRRARSRSLSAEDNKRAKLMLLVAKGLSFSEICCRLNCTDRYISVWKRRFGQERLKGLDSRYRGSQRRVRTAQMEAKILEATRKGPSDGTTHWSSYRLAKHLGVSHTTVHRVWRQFGIQPHRLRRYMVSDDPQFEEKAADVIGLYLNPPEHAAVFAVDEKSAIQALDRLDPVLPLSPGRAERHGFEYYRHGTLSLYAALNTRTGQVQGQTTPRHTSTEFVGFLSQIIATQPKEKEIHIIADNLSAHKTKEVSAFLQANPNVRIHYTPTYSSWLNEVEIWFSKIQRQIIARGVFSSVGDLARKIMRFIRNYNKTATPIRWRYTDEKQRISLAI
jgi:transposase/DNA-binding CsgD family transcriptional regulator